MRIFTTTVQANTLSDLLTGGGGGDGVSGIFNVSGDGAVHQLVSNIVNIALPLAGLAAVILLIVGGYKMITSQGNPDKLKDAKDMITNAIIGLVFILLSISILLLISNVFNLGISN